MDPSNFFTESYVPPTAFYFEVAFIGNGNNKMDSSFQEVSGLKVTVENPEKWEGGDNVFVHHLPKSINYENLVLKRCLTKSLAFEKWCRDTLVSFEFKPMDISLRLLSSQSEPIGSNIPIPLAAWSIEQAFPISWELATFGNAKDEFAIETLTLKYRKFNKTL